MPTSNQHPIEITYSRHFLEWLHEEKISLTFTTYQTNRLFLLGLKENGKLSTFERLFDRPMGMYATRDRLYLGSRYQIWQLDNALPHGEVHEGYDALYVPRRSFTTGDVDIHDVALSNEGRLLFINTLYSCLASPSDRYSFRPVWKPPFISKIAPEDRCHLNGLAVNAEGAPRYVTAVSRSDVFSGWRKRRKNGGVVIDVQEDQIVAAGLSMPHSPRLHKGRLWLLNAGYGDFGYVNLKSGTFEPVAFCPGFARGMAFHEHYALVGLSKPRYVQTFEGLSLEERLKAKDADPLCGIAVIDLRSGRMAHWVEVEGLVSEIYDVQVLPGIRRPMALGFKTDEVCRFVTIDFEEEAHFQPLKSTPEARSPIDFMAMRDPLSDGMKGAPTQEPAHPRARSAPSPRPQLVSYRFHVNPELSAAVILHHYAHLIYPPLSFQMRQEHQPPHFIAAAASVQNQVVGLALAQPQPQAMGGARLISLAVAEEHRRRGVATRLLAHMERSLAERDFAHLDLVYTQEWKSLPIVEHMLAQNGWLPPQTKIYRYKGNVSSLVEAKWLYDERAHLPPGYELFDWVTLTKEERNALERRLQVEEIQAAFSPFQGERFIEPLNSLGLRCAGEVVGWVVTLRSSQDNIEYASLFVMPEHRARDLALSLLGAALRRQVESEVPYAIFQVEADNRGMLAFTQRYLRRFTFKAVEVRLSRKVLRPTRR
jgi:uncharacterized protein (TIGR03032 family)